MNHETFANELAAMDPVELALGAGAAGIVLTIMLVGSALWYFISALGYYKMYQKAGEKGWKAFIPYYKKYICFKFAWEPKKFWLYFIGALIIQFVPTDYNAVVALVCAAIAIAVIVIVFKLDLRIAKSFGKSTAWGVLLFFFPFIISLILGFGKAAYIGNTSVEEASDI